MGQELLTSSLAFISNQLSKWSLDKDEPSTAILVELQKKRPALAFRPASTLATEEKVRRLLLSVGWKMDSR